MRECYKYMEMKCLKRILQNNDTILTFIRIFQKANLEIGNMAVFFFLFTQYSFIYKDLIYTIIIISTPLVPYCMTVQICGVEIQGMKEPSTCQ